MRPFRFGLSGARAPGPVTAWLDKARAAEDLGYDVLLTADHITAEAGSPLVPLAAAAQVTTTLRFGTLVLNNDFHHPLLLARDAAALDDITGGRFELGLGAGYALAEYEAAGLAFDRGATRLARLADSIAVLDPVLRGEAVDHRGDHHRVVSEPIVTHRAQQPRLPLLVAGGGPQSLALAGRTGDIVGLSGLHAHKGWIGIRGLSCADAAEQIASVRAGAGDRFDDVELNALVQRVILTDRPRDAAEEFAALLDGAATPEDVLDSPYLLIGSVEHVAEHLLRCREELGITYFAVLEPTMKDFARVIEHLR